MHKATTILFFLLAFSFSAFSQCTNLTNKEIKNMLGTFIYDSSRETSFKNSEAKQKIEYEVLLFASNQYKMCWDVSEAPSGITIKLYEKQANGKMNILFNSDVSEPENAVYATVLKNISRQVVIVYEIPANSKKGCIKYVLGFSMKNEIRKETNPKARVKVK